MKELQSRDLAFSICLSFLISFIVVACSETPTGEEEQEEEALELYEPFLGKWKSTKTELFYEFKKVTETKGIGSSYHLNNTGYCDNGYRYISESSFEWTMVDTTLPIKTIRIDFRYRYWCGEEDVSLSPFNRGYEIRGDTLKNGSSTYFRVEDY